MSRRPGSPRASKKSASVNAGTGALQRIQGLLAYKTLQLGLLGGLFAAVVIGTFAFLATKNDSNAEPNALAGATSTRTAVKTASPRVTASAAATATPPPPTPYTVKDGDSATAIAKSIGVKDEDLTEWLQDFAELNGGSGTVQPGQVVQVPPTPQPTPPAQASASGSGGTSTPTGSGNTPTGSNSGGQAATSTAVVTATSGGGGGVALPTSTFSAAATSTFAPAATSTFPPAATSTFPPEPTSTPPPPVNTAAPTSTSVPPTSTPPAPTATQSVPASMSLSPNRATEGQSVTLTLRNFPANSTVNVCLFTYCYNVTVDGTGFYSAAGDPLTDTATYRGTYTMTADGPNGSHASASLTIY